MTYKEQPLDYKRQDKINKDTSFLFDFVDIDPFKPTSKSGVYAVCVRNGYGDKFKERIIYIGSSSNVFKRVMAINHPYRVLYDKYPVVYIKDIESEDYRELEKKLISLYKPLLNKQWK